VAIQPEQQSAATRPTNTGRERLKPVLLPAEPTSADHLATRSHLDSHRLVTDQARWPMLQRGEPVPAQPENSSELLRTGEGVRAGHDADRAEYTRGAVPSL